MSSSLVHDPKNNTKEKAVANDNKNFFILVQYFGKNLPR